MVSYKALNTYLERRSSNLCYRLRNYNTLKHATIAKSKVANFCCSFGNDGYAILYLKFCHNITKYNYNQYLYTFYSEYNLQCSVQCVCGYKFQACKLWISQQSQSINLIILINSIYYLLLFGFSRSFGEQQHVVCDVRQYPVMSNLWNCYRINGN